MSNWIPWAAFAADIVQFFTNALAKGQRGENLSAKDITRVRRVIARTADPDDPVDDPEVHAARVLEEDPD